MGSPFSADRLRLDVRPMRPESEVRPRRTHEPSHMPSQRRAPSPPSQGAWQSNMGAKRPNRIADRIEVGGGGRMWKAT